MTTPFLFEEWRPIPEWEGLYEVSDQGRIRGVDRMVEVHTSSGVFMRTKAGHAVKPKIHKGYPHVYLSRGGVKKWKAVHTLVLLAFVGLPGAGQECCHDNDIRTDNRLKNLRWDTKSSNQFDKVRNGRHHNAVKTHCKNKHEFTPENTSIYATKLRGGVTGLARKCLECNRARSSARDAQMRERVA